MTLPPMASVLRALLGGGGTRDGLLERALGQRPLAQAPASAIGLALRNLAPKPN
jgi:hypothetical protein